jgi:hypothetical protein
MKVLRGKGKLYNAGGTFLGRVDYDINYQNPASGKEWSGEIIPESGIIPAGEHILELEDGRQARCIIRIKTTSSFGLVVDSFDVEGAGHFE